MVIIMAMSWEPLVEAGRLEAGESLLISNAKVWLQVTVAIVEGTVAFLDPLTRIYITPESVTHICRVELPR